MSELKYKDKFVQIRKWQNGDKNAQFKILRKISFKVFKMYELSSNFYLKLQKTNQFFNWKYGKANL